MNTKKIILCTIFLSSIVSSLSMFGMEKEEEGRDQQSNLPKVDQTAAFFASSPTARIAIATTFLMAIRLYWKESEKKPNYYDWANLKKFLQIQLLVSNPEEYVQNLKDFVDNFIIGQLFKDRYVKLNTTDNTLKSSKRKCPATGIGGNIASMISVSDKSQKLLKNIFKFAAALFTIDKLVFNNAFVQYCLDREKPATGILSPYHEGSLNEQKRTADAQERTAKAQEENKDLLQGTLEALLQEQKRNATAQKQNADLLQGLRSVLDTYNKNVAAQPQIPSYYAQPPLYPQQPPLYTPPVSSAPTDKEETK